MGSCLNKELLKLAFSFEEGLTLEISAFETLYWGQFTLTIQLVKPHFLEGIFIQVV